MGKGNYYYFVEGEDEQKIINTLKSELRCIISGKVKRINVVRDYISNMHVREIGQNCVVIFVYDTDVINTAILERNISFLKKKSIKNVWCIPQVDNLEDEIVRACNIKSAIELTSSASIKDFKKDLIKSKNLDVQLTKHDFDIKKFWDKLPKNSFEKFGNDSDKVKK